MLQHISCQVRFYLSNRFPGSQLAPRGLCEAQSLRKLAIWAMLFFPANVAIGVGIGGALSACLALDVFCRHRPKLKMRRIGRSWKNRSDLEFSLNTHVFENTPSWGATTGDSLGLQFEARFSNRQRVAERAVAVVFNPRTTLEFLAKNCDHWAFSRNRHWSRD